MILLVRPIALTILVLALSSPAPAAEFTGRVIKVLDGDSLVVLSQGSWIEVRLFGVDAPEYGQTYADQAKYHLSRLVYNRKVNVRVRDTDQYGRVVGEVVLPGGFNVGQEMVKSGLAWWYRRYAPDDADLARFEAKARQAKSGLWKVPHPIPPWKFREENRE